MNSRDPSRTGSKDPAGGRRGGLGGAAGFDLQDSYVALQLADLLVGDDNDPLVRVEWEKKVVDLGRETGVEPVYVDDAFLLLPGE